MGPRAIIKVSLNWKTFGFGVGVDFEWKCTVIWIGPLMIDTQLGFTWRLQQYQEWFDFYKVDRE